MVNSFIFTGLILLAGLAGGLIGSACAKSRRMSEETAMIKGRLEFLEGRVQGMDERLSDSELLIGDTPTGGLLGRVGTLEEARRKEGPKLAELTACVDAQSDKLQELEGQLDSLKGGLELHEGGASLELAGLRKAVQRLEEKANG